MEKTNEDDLDWTEYDHEGGATVFRRKQLADAVDAEDVGCSLYELPAGARSWPYHYHTANEEALYVLAGEGTLRAADGEHPLRAGRPGLPGVLPRGRRGRVLGGVTRNPDRRASRSQRRSAG